ncbi:aromatic ring-hydroxylating oxygenase subunit alpha [Paraliomyxa miuraensis]|uniref:aromatic ring-hydroxylating oxygenase subunit alpha n=1 Tax=Paraliomyxa miuraensis TaxID=376150 RepID=UPI0022542A75|nr:aromatic ring-hydroxylating dioxygenase subunit alpha [Paraliomyxa miuraensis]MCX4243464.1 aromatic ring-hydroxylating dioxygenase subunit alpha [Paraliomyxa miuraensis]
MFEDLEDRWYVIADAAQVRAGRPLLLHRFGQRLVLWRDVRGAVVGLPDRCPHRGVSLSGGRIREGCIECPFHGFCFDGQGQCTHIPAMGSDQRVARRIRTPSLVLRQAHGWIWQWRGRARERYPEIEYFDAVRPTDSMRTTRTIWGTNYVRVIENQLDVMHPPFVHRRSFGRGLRPDIEPRTEIDGDRIRVYIDDPRPRRATDPGAYVELRAPNAWIITLRRTMGIVAAFVPIDETHTEIYARFHQRVVRWPGLSWIYNRIMTASNALILREDQRVVEGSDPPRPTPGVRELLVPGDQAVIAYRRLLSGEARARRKANDRSAERLAAAEPEEPQQ